MTTLTFPRPMGVQLAEYERDGHRPLIGDEADALRYLDTVTVLDTEMGDRQQAVVQKWQDARTRAGRLGRR